MSEIKTRLADMTIDDLKALIGQMIDARLGHSSFTPYRLGEPTPESWQAIKENLIKSEPGQPSPTEILREERELRSRNTTLKPLTDFPELAD
jgi:hypothetical protein